uniref:Superoxide dismutase n=1 Tax=Riptortus pedestris TaxID=329032 RepID=R4WD37_RIPPE|nr:superoxide dismutase 2 [Riptortus pedestris]
MFGLSKGITSLSRTAIRRNAHTLPDLPYAINALEPVICGEIMELHHKKHHNAYVTNLNAAETQLKEAVSKNDISKVIALQPALKFNGGGHINHSIFWCNLSPNGGQPSQELSTAICEAFGSFDNLLTQMQAMTNAIQGSGWGWLGYNSATKRLQLATCANQDPLQATTGLIPLFGIDVWEHAYYLQYKNVRPEYTKKIFDIANWNDISERFKKAAGC